MKAPLLLLAALFCLAPAPLLGQVVEVGGGGSFAPGSRIGYHSSTVQEGIQRGWASVIEAQGLYNLNTAQALIYLEQARALSLENQLRYVQAYFQAKEINRLYRFGRRPLSLGDPGQYSVMNYRPTPLRAPSRNTTSLAENPNAPRRLSRAELDPIFGSIDWPVALMLPQLARQREELEELFRDRDVSNSGLGSHNEREVQRVARVMQRRLDKMLSDVPADQYFEGTRFLRSLAYEARFVPQIDGLARR